jgi:HAD superfamily phosphatase (TIGR01668 family)
MDFLVSGLGRSPNFCGLEPARGGQKAKRGVQGVDGTGDSVDTQPRFAARAPRVTDVALEGLLGRGLRGIILDLDNTSCAYGQPELADGVADWVEQARAAGFAVVLVSNNFSERVAAVGVLLDVPSVPNALKPLPFGFLLALRLLGTARSETVVIGDQLFTDVLGAKLLGLHAILTEPIVARDFPLTRVLRMLERLLFRRLPS